MIKDDIIAWGKEEEATLRSNEWNFIGGVQQFNEENIVSTDVTSLKGIYDASISQEEKTESYVDGVHFAEIKDSGSPHLVPLIDWKKVHENSYFDIIKIKQGRERRKNRPILGMISTPKTDEEEVYLP